MSTTVWFNQATLKIDGRDYPLSADFSLRFVDAPGRTSFPVLYHRGKRLTKRWSLTLYAASAADKHENANTADFQPKPAS